MGEKAAGRILAATLIVALCLLEVPKIPILFRAWQQEQPYCIQPILDPVHCLVSESPTGWLLVHAIHANVVALARLLMLMIDGYYPKHVHQGLHYSFLVL